MNSSFLKDIEDADMVLIAFGQEYMNIKLTKDDLWNDAVKYYKNNTKGIMSEVYNTVEQLIKGKDYFVVDLNMDGEIYNSNFNRMRVVTPCGNYQKLQCGCNDKIIDVEDAYDNEQPFCEECCKHLLPNVYVNQEYNENGYLKQWNLYNIWLQRSISKKLLVIEIGVDYNVPSVVRWPLERVVYISQKAKLYMISEKFAQYSQELSGKVITVKNNPVDYFSKIQEC